MRQNTPRFLELVRAKIENVPRDHPNFLKFVREMWEEDYGDMSKLAGIL